MGSRQAVHLLTENTPNGKKVQILLEELRAKYGFSWETHLIDIATDEQKKDWFLALNPNGLPGSLLPSVARPFVSDGPGIGRIPVLLDSTKDAPVSVTESSAILVYLQEHYDTDNVFGFVTPAERSQALQWLFFWHAAAPVRGQLSHLRSPEESQPGELQLELLPCLAHPLTQIRHHRCYKSFKNRAAAHLLSVRGPPERPAQMRCCPGVPRR